MHAKFTSTNFSVENDLAIRRKLVKCSIMRIQTFAFYEVNREVVL